jgi:23S rRNA (adenine1618-N6)-methyltransferase
LTADAEVGPLSSSLRPEDGNFDVLVCNPPFFGSAEEAARFNKTSKDANPDDDADTSEAANTHEMICDGGEERFLSM